MEHGIEPSGLMAHDLLQDVLAGDDVAPEVNLARLQLWPSATYPSICLPLDISILLYSTMLYSIPLWSTLVMFHSVLSYPILLHYILCNASECCGMLRYAML